MEEKKRPFKDLNGYEIREIGFEAYYDKADLGTLDLCIEEITIHRPSRVLEVYRKELNDLRRALEAYSFLDKGAIHPDREWMGEISNMMSRWKKETEGDWNIYLVCLVDRKYDDHMLYLGRTQMDPRKRYEEMKEGRDPTKKFIRDDGIGLLEPLFSHLKGMGQFEADLKVSFMYQDLEGNGFDVTWGVD